MLLQQSAQLGIIRSHGSLCVIHTAMIVGREDARQEMRTGFRVRTGSRWSQFRVGPRACVLSFRTILIRLHATTATRGAGTRDGRLDALRLPGGARQLS